MHIKRKLFVISIISILVLVISFTIFPAGESQAIIPFGGQIKSVFYCTCSNNILLTIGPPNGGSLIYQPGGTRLYAYGQVFRPGPWTLGNYSPGGACLVYVGVGCAAIGSQGTIKSTGTSL